jgi:hypothetical protein
MPMPRAIVCILLHFVASFECARHHDAAAGCGKEIRRWALPLQTHVKALLVSWCDWCQEHGSSCNLPQAVASAAEDTLLCLKAPRTTPLQHCVWRLWAAFVSGGSSCDLMEIFSNSSAFDVNLSFPVEFFISPDGAANVSAHSSSAAAAAAAFVKTLNILTEGFAVARVVDAHSIRVAFDATQHGEQFAMMVMSICSSSSGGSSGGSMSSVLRDMQNALVTNDTSVWERLSHRLLSASDHLSNLMNSPALPSRSSLSLICTMMTGGSGLDGNVDNLKLLWALYTPLLPLAGLNATPVFNHIRSRDAAISVVR